MLYCDTVTRSELSVRDLEINYQSFTTVRHKERLSSRFGRLKPDILIAHLDSDIITKDLITELFAVNPYLKLIIVGRMISADELPVYLNGRISSWLPSMDSKDALNAAIRSAIHELAFSENISSATVLSEKKTEYLLHLEEVVNRSPAVILLRSPRPGYPILMVTDNISDLVGYTWLELSEPPTEFMRLVHPDDIQKVNSEIMHQLEQSKTRFSQKYRILTKAGQVKWIYEDTIIQYDSLGQVARLEGIIWDISELEALSGRL